MGRAAEQKAQAAPETVAAAAAASTEETNTEPKEGEVDVSE